VIFINTVYFSDFKGTDDLARFRVACDYLREHPKTTFIIEPGTYILTDAVAKRLQEEIMAGKYGINPQPMIFSMDYEYVIGLDLTGMQDITINAQGVTFLVDGFMEIISIQHCKNITINGLSIDLVRKAYTVGTVEACGDDYVDVRFSEKDTMLCPEMAAARLVVRNKTTGNIVDIVYTDGKEWVSENLMRFYGPRLVNCVGYAFNVSLSFHYRPAILIYDAENTVLNNVTIYNQCGMGIVGHRSENILMDKIRIVPNDDSGMSTTTDATHFTSCKGTIRFDGCEFEGSGDDCTNVHTYYQTITDVSGKNCVVEIFTPDGTHCQKSDVPDVGDILEYMKLSDLAPIETYTVVASEEIKGTYKSKLTLDKVLPDSIKDNYFINASRMPRLEFVNCHTKNNLARPVLIKTRNVLVENCVFEGATGTAIHIGAEGSWHEGANSENVIIRNNKMLNCATTDHGRVCDAGGVGITVQADNPDKPIHRNIIIENNEIDCPDTKYSIYASNVDGLIIQGNKIKKEIMIDKATCKNIEKYNNLW